MDECTRNSERPRQDRPLQVNRQWHKQSVYNVSITIKLDEKNWNRFQEIDKYLLKRFRKNYLIKHICAPDFSLRMPNFLFQTG